MGLSKGQKWLFEFLKQKQSANDTFSAEDILRITRWTPSTLTTYQTKGQLSEFLIVHADGLMSAKNVLKLSESQFARRLSQAKNRRELGHTLSSEFAKSLLKKSRDNMVLAIEIYNRPSVENRYDAFVILSVTAWDQLLKAKLIHREKSDDAIYKKQPSKDQERRAKSVSKLINCFFSSDDLVAKNLYELVYLRDNAVHKLLPDMQGLLSRIFQSCIFNYIAEFEDFSRSTFLQNQYSGMASLVVGWEDACPLNLQSRFGAHTSRDVLDLIQRLENQIRENNDERFAVPLDVSPRYVRNSGNALIAFNASFHDPDASTEAIVITAERTTDRGKTHPYKFTQLINEINKELRKRIGDSAFRMRVTKNEQKNGKPAVNSYSMTSIIEYLKWKERTNNDFCSYDEPSNTYTYSPQAITEIVQQILSANGNKFIRECREKYGRKSKSSSAKQHRNKRT